MLLFTGAMIGLFYPILALWVARTQRRGEERREEKKREEKKAIKERREEKVLPWVCLCNLPASLSVSLEESVSESAGRF